MGWRGSETGRDSKTLRKLKVEKGRKEWWGLDLESGEEGMGENGHQPISGVGEERKGDTPRLGEAVPPAAPAQASQLLPSQSENREGGRTAVAGSWENACQTA